MMEYFYNSLGIVSGVLLPFVLLILLRSALSWLEADLKNRKRSYERFMSPKYWHFRKAEQAPNKDYVTVHFENGESKEMLRLGIEKKHLTEYMK
jgi:hypothetical protein